MSYIVPMKKPICINCPFRSLDSCTLIYLMSDKEGEVTIYVNTMTVSPDCPLIELPPHGRIIDVETIEEIRFHDADGYHVVNGEQLCELEIETKTVIEAEGEKE